MALDISSLARAFIQLKESMDLLHSDLAKTNPVIKRAFDRSAIQAFEFTYDSAVKMIVRQMRALSPNPGEFNAMTFKDQMRAAARAGLIPDAISFFDYREKRNKASHIYDEEVALEVLSVLEAFSQDAQFLLDKLREQNP